jgi:membrane-associated phospholipid phosphatase
MMPTRFLSRRVLVPALALAVALSSAGCGKSISSSEQLAVTPPGHWNAMEVPCISSAQFSEVRAARALALLNVALHDAAVGCWEAKYYYFNPRPSQLDPSIKVMTGLPNFPSYVSGHSDFSAAGSGVLSYPFPSGPSYFDAQKQEAAMSRRYAGIHYRSDIVVGVAHGQRIGG